MAPKRPLVDRLVDALQDQVGKFHADRLGGLSIGDQFKPARLLDRDITGFRAFEYLVDQYRGAPVLVGLIDAVTHQTAGLGVI